MKPLPSDIGSYTCSRIIGFETEARVGVHTWEKHAERPNRLIVDVEMYGVAPTASRADRSPVIDYDPVRAALLTWPKRPHTPYLETLAEDLIALCFANPLVTACRVSIVKPDIFNEADGAGIEIFRQRNQEK